jgi:hypothetical protein
MLALKREKRELIAEIQSLAGTVKNAQEPFPHLYQRHKAIDKGLTKLRKALTSDRYSRDGQKGLFPQRTGTRSRPTDQTASWRA